MQKKSKVMPRKKYGKLSRRGVKMTCSKCHQQGHNNKACKYVVLASHQPGDYHNMSAQANNQLLSVMILQLLEEFNKLEEAGEKAWGGGDDTSTVTRGQQGERGRGDGASTSTGGNKRPKTVEFDIYTDDISGRQTLNPGTSGERVVTPAVFKCATPTNIDIGYKPRGLK
ncbi:hypothetical protein KY285_004865 [Solanum tuberosum]|nr:hypothetical protein KY289_005303 [Solanum tuberosum]KAH0751717.1 hypothetical protein KY285_004865 [Solanum tuberosum]